MRFYESLSYLNNNNIDVSGNGNGSHNNNSSYQHHANQNIDRSNNCGTVKTFTSNGNHQSSSSNDADTILESIKTDNTHNSYFEVNESTNVDGGYSANQNWPLETDFGKSLAAAFNESYCFYGSHRTLKTRENDLNDDDNANGNGNDNGSNETKKLQNSIDLIDDSSSDIEAELNHLINRSNLCRQNFEYESNKGLTTITTNTDDQFMDEEEEFSSLTISASLSVDNKPSYPRGIINPNYPGFQHLAHTLSEQFVDPHSNNQTESMSDSDFSEVDSDFPSEGHSTENNNNNNIHDGNDDSNGNKIIEADPKSAVSDNLNTVEEILRTVFESNSNHLSSVIEMFAEKETAANEQTEIDTFDDCMNDMNACDLETYLNKFEDGGINIEKVKPLIKLKPVPATSVVIEPDVIRKSSSCECGFEQTTDKPDILLDVTEDSTVVLSGEKEEPGSAWSITPVDIVGNFEQEVERELGLLVTGYRNTAFNNGDGDAVAALSDKHTDKKFLQKTADAALSSANDTISMDQKKLNANETTGMKNAIPTAIVKPKYQKSSFDERQLPTVAHMSEDSISAWYDKSSSNGAAITTTVAAAAVEISTHPKKIQLPEFDRKAKKHMKPMTTTAAAAACMTAPIPAPRVAKTAHNINAEIAAHINQCAKVGNMESSASDRKESVGSVVTHRRSVDRKSSSSSGTKLAVVQPRKKERMDQATLMETILQMQIKKNAQLYRNKGNNNTSNTTITGSNTIIEKPQANRLNNNNNTINNNNNNNSTGAAAANVVNNHNNNNNNRENRMKAERNQAKKYQKENSGCFDVYNIETALPVIDLETIENHLKLKKEDERRKRNDREEIRRRLAMGAEDDYLTKISATKPGRKPSLQSRLQEGKNLQICFVNDAAAAADVDSLSSDSESCPKLSKPMIHTNQTANSLIRLNNTNAIQPNPYNSRPLSMKKSTTQEKSRSSAITLDALKTDEDPKEIDFFTKQARLQIEARMALAQAKDIAHMQMEMERQKQMESPITGMIRSTIEKVGYHFPAEKRRVSRQMLTDMNVAQLQIIVNDFHTQIESLNEQLVKYLMDRDDLHMGQDSMLVDIEDLTRYLGAKKDPYSNSTERKKPIRKYHSMKSPKYMVSQKNQSNQQQQQQQQHRLASQIGKS